jgi:predicted PhzF superfamily epimerase YddE/YHI9
MYLLSLFFEEDTLIIKNIEVEVKIEDKEPVEVKVSGNAVIIFRSELSLND